MYKYATVQTAHLKKAHITARRLQHIKGHNSQDARSMATRQHICTFYVCVYMYAHDTWRVGGLSNI